MRHVAAIITCLAILGPISTLAATSKEGGDTGSGPPASSLTGPGSAQFTSGRFQLTVVPGHSGSPFLLDTATGCLWQQVQNPDTKRTTFVELDVENLHWSWGSGAQQALAARVDSATIPDDQKRLLKENLQRTACGLSHVVLTPGPPVSASPTTKP